MRSALWEILETIILALALFWGVQMVAERFRVVGSSMEPSLKEGEYLLVNKAVYFQLPSPISPNLSLPFSPFHPPKRGDIVVLRSPQNPSGPFNIKRIIGLPGEVVEVKDGKVDINGEPLDEPFVREATRYTAPPTTVPPDYYYVLGDNRNNSIDSHVWGLVPRQNIVGKAWVTYWPADKWGLAPNYAFARGN